MSSDPENPTTEGVPDNDREFEDEPSMPVEVNWAKLDKLVGGESVNTQNEKPEVKKRVKALKKIQAEVSRIEVSFYTEMHALECKYLPQYQPYFEKRREIVLGLHEPTEEECDFVEAEGSDSEEAEKEKAAEDSEDKNNVPKETGIPEFWLTVIQNADMLSELTEECDLPILKHLTDITVDLKESPMGFTLLFHFSPNEYFTNSVLTKTYNMSCEVDEEDPFSFEGPEIVSCQGCPIDWAEGKKVTEKIVKKKQKHKTNKTIRTVTKTVTAPSFFNFFNPPDLPEGSIDEEIQLRLTTDFEIGQYIREIIIPRAVLYYTGEACDDDDDDEEEEEEESGSEDEDDGDEGGKGTPNFKPLFMQKGLPSKSYKFDLK